jgi:hypothetical protein
VEVSRVLGLLQASVRPEKARASLGRFLVKLNGQS